MSLAKLVPEGLKCQECERGVGGNKSPIRYIPESDPIQEALEKKKKTTYFKLTVPSTGSELSMAQWTSGTPEQFLLHVHAAIHACKQMELDVNFSRAQEAVSTKELHLEVAKEEYAQVRTSERKKAKGNKGEAMSADPESLALTKAEYEKATQALLAAKIAVTTAGAKAFELYANLLSDEARSAW